MCEITLSKENEIRVDLKGEIDHHNSTKLREEIDKSIKKNKPKKICLNFKNVTFMDSSGVGLVMGRFKFAKKIGADLELKNLSDSAYRMMKMSGLDRIVKITKEKGVKK